MWQMFAASAVGGILSGLAGKQEQPDIKEQAYQNYKWSIKDTIAGSFIAAKMESGSDITPAEQIQYGLVDKKGLPMFPNGLPLGKLTKQTRRDAIQNMIDLAGEYGPTLAKQARELAREADPTGYAAREKAGELVLSDDFVKKVDEKAAPKAEMAEKLDEGRLPRYDTFGAGERAGYGGKARAELEKVLYEDLMRGGELGDWERTEAEQQYRKGAAARGNILSDSSAMQEAMGTGRAAAEREARRRAAVLDFLKSNETTQDTEKEYATWKNLGERAKYDDLLAQRRYNQDVINMNNQAKQQEWQNYLSAINQQNEANANRAQAMQAYASGQSPAGGFNWGQWSGGLPNQSLNSQRGFQMPEAQANPWLQGAALGLQAYGTYMNAQNAQNAYVSPTANQTRI